MDGIGCRRFYMSDGRYKGDYILDVTDATYRVRRFMCHIELIVGAIFEVLYKCSRGMSF